MAFIALWPEESHKKRSQFFIAFFNAISPLFYKVYLILLGCSN